MAEPALTPEQLEAAACERCGCTPEAACAGGCGWIEAAARDGYAVCSACLMAEDPLAWRVEEIGVTVYKLSLQLRVCLATLRDLAPDVLDVAQAKVDAEVDAEMAAECDETKDMDAGVGPEIWIP